MKVFVVSLLKSKERRRSISKELMRSGIDFEFFDAIYGKNLSLDDRNKYCDQSALIDNPRWLNDGAIGCALSHAFLYNKIASECPHGAIILEDDMTCNESLKDIARFIAGCPDILKSNCVILLYYRSFDIIKLTSHDRIKVSDSQALLYPTSKESTPITTGGYFISQSAAKSLYNSVIPVRRTADCWPDFLNEKAITTLLCAYPRPLVDACFKSEIDYNEKYRGHLISLLSKFINFLKIPFLNKFLKEKRRKREMEMSRVVICDMKSTLQPLIKYDNKI